MGCFFCWLLPGDPAVTALGDYASKDAVQALRERADRVARQGPSRGPDLRYDLTIDFEEAVFGAEKEIVVPRHETCPNCQGSGAEPGTHPIRCPQCNGTGEVRRQQQTFLGSFVQVSTCPRCQGEREIVIRSRLAELWANEIGEPERARPHYERILELDPGHAEAAGVVDDDQIDPAGLFQLGTDAGPGPAADDAQKRPRKRHAGHRRSSRP